MAGRNTKPRRDKLWIYILIAVVPFVIFIGSLAAVLSSRYEYVNYKNSLAASFMYSDDAPPMAEYRGHRMLITRRSTEDLHLAVLNCGFAHEEEALPDGERFVISFADGSQLTLVAIDDRTVVFDYLSREGEHFIYRSYEVSRMVTFERLISEDWGNTPLDQHMQKRTVK